MSPSGSTRDDRNDRDENRIAGVDILGDVQIGETVSARVSYRYDRPYGRADYQWYARTPGGSVYALNGETGSSLFIDGSEVNAGDEVQVRVVGRGDTRGSASSGWRTVRDAAPLRQILIGGGGTMTDRVGDSVMYVITAQGAPDGASPNITWDSAPDATIVHDNYRNGSALLTITAVVNTRPGSYRFSVSMPGYSTAHATLTIGSSALAEGDG